MARRKSIVGFEPFHAPDNKAQGFKCIGYDRNLLENLWFHSLTRLVTVVELIAEALDRVIHRNSDVCRPVSEQLNRRIEHTDRRRERRGFAMANGLTKMLAVQLVRAINEVNLHVVTLATERGHEHDYECCDDEIRAKGKGRGSSGTAREHHHCGHDSSKDESKEHTA